MKVLYSPQVSNEKINYTFEDEKIIATIDNVTDEFDFANMPDGILEGIKTTLPFNPILNAKKVDGILYVELLNFINEDATEEEKFPEWRDI